MKRREYLLTAGVTLPTILAGCAGDENGDDGVDDTESDPTDGNGEEPEDDPQPDDDPNGDDGTDGDEDGDTDDDVDSVEPQSFSGTGAAVEDGIRIDGGLTVVDATHTGGQSNFQVSLVDDSEFDDLFVNEIGEYDGETADLIEGGEYLLDVEADGSWDIEIRQPRAASGDSLPQSFDADRNRVFGPYEFSGTHTATGEHHGQGNFIVHVYPQDYEMFGGELVFNELGEYDGETTFSFDGVGWVAIEADGEWSLELE